MRFSVTITIDQVEQPCLSGTPPDSDGIQLEDSCAYPEPL
jgi:hypothetical protein